MIIIKIQGGLGNQMFQYAIGAIMGLIKKEPVLLDTTFFNLTKKADFTSRKFELFIFPNDYEIADQMQINHFKKLSYLNKIKKKIKLNYPKKFVEPTLHFYNEVFSLKTPLYLDGFFQSYKYFIGYEDFIKEIFKFPIEKIGIENEKLLEAIKAKNSISLHVRRGDYVSDKKTQEFHGECGVDYYIKAIDLMASKIDNLLLVFFSDDTEWTREQFEKLPHSSIFIDHNKDEDGWKDMFLMSNCKHNVIANSSFSWWGAFLNNNPEKCVFVPEKWVLNEEINEQKKDMIPSSWNRI